MYQADIQLYPARKHVAQVDRRTEFEARCRDGVGAGLVFAQVKVLVEFGGTGELEAEVQAEAYEHVEVHKRVAHHERDFEHHDVDAGIVVTEVRLVRIAVMAVREHQFGDHVQVLDPERQCHQKAGRSLEAESPSRGLVADKRVDAGASANAQQDGTRETFGTLLVDLGFRGLFSSVLCIFGCVFRVVGEFACCRTVVRLRTAPFGRGCRFVIIEIVKFVCEGRHSCGEHCRGQERYDSQVHA